MFKDLFRITLAAQAVMLTALVCNKLGLLG